MTFRGLRLAVLIGAGAAGLLATAGCGEAVRQGTGSAFLVMDSLLGAPGGTDSLTFGNVLQSDVSTKGGVFEDPGRVTLRLAAKDITTSLTSNNTVTINRYRVVFRRSDGRNQPGSDVPYAFDGAVTFSVGVEPVTAGFTLVRAQAKLEPPLINLRENGGRIVISTVAEVTTSGRPAIFVPYPHHEDQQQKINADTVADVGGAWVMTQSGFTEEAVLARVETFLQNPETLFRAAENARSMGRPDAARRLGNLVTAIASGWDKNTGKTAEPIITKEG